jgi:hypothetical protein
MNIRIWFIWLLTGLLGLVACGPQATAVQGVATDIVIIYQREGGFTGITQVWTIYTGNYRGGRLLRHAGFVYPRG